MYVLAYEELKGHISIIKNIKTEINKSLTFSGVKSNEYKKKTSDKNNAGSSMIKTAICLRKISTLFNCDAKIHFLNDRLMKRTLPKD